MKTMYQAMDVQKNWCHKSILTFLFYLWFVLRGSVWHGGKKSIYRTPHPASRAGQVIQHRTPGDSSYIIVYVNGTSLCCTVHSPCDCKWSPLCIECNFLPGLSSPTQAVLMWIKSFQNQLFLMSERTSFPNFKLPFFIFVPDFT